MNVHHNVKILTWFNFFTDLKLFAPIAIIYFSQVTGSFTQGMAIFAIVTVSAALFEIPTGVFSDKIGRKKTIICGAIASVICTVLYASAHSFGVFALGAVFCGLALSFYSGNNDALLYDTLLEEKKEAHFAEYLGKVSSMFQIALAIAAVVGGILATWSFQLIMWLSVFPQIICLFLAFRIQEPKAHSMRSGNIFAHLTEAYRNFFSNKKLKLLSLSSVIGYGFGEAGFEFEKAFFATLWPVWAIGLITAVCHAGAATSFHFSGKLINKFGELPILLFQNIWDRTTSIFSTLFPSILSPVLMSSGSFIYGVGKVSKNTLLQKEFTNHQRATMGSLNSFAGSLFFGIVAVSLGYFADTLSPAKALLMLHICQFVNVLIYTKLFRQRG